MTVAPAKESSYDDDDGGETCVAVSVTLTFEVDSPSSSRWIVDSRDVASRPCRNVNRSTGRSLRPRPRQVRGLSAAPPPLTPHQARRPAEARQVLDLDQYPIQGLGAHTASRAPRDGRRRLDRDHHLVRGLTQLEHPEAIQSQQRFRQADTVAHRQGSSVAAVKKPQRLAGPLNRAVDALLPHSPVRREDRIAPV
jgi:hypothetical protein